MDHPVLSSHSVIIHHRSMFFRTPTPTPLASVSPLVARRQLGVGRGRGTRAAPAETAAAPGGGGPSAQSTLLQRVRDKRNQQLQFP